MASTSYLINSNIHGYERVNIEDFKFEDKREDTIITIVDKACDDKLAIYYNMFNNTLKNNNRLILIGVNDENKSFKVLASLMVTFQDYNIYQIEDKNSLGAKELQSMCDRTPGIEEVQTFVGGDVTAYSDISTIVFGIESMVSEGNESQLRDFLEQHIISVESLVYTLNYMKHICDSFNSGELIDKINNLKDKITNLEKQLETSKKSAEDMKYAKEKLQVEVEDYKREISKLKVANTELKASSESGVSVVRQYNTVNTQLINCKAKLVMYCKEISYVTYANSLIMHFLKYCENKHLKVKLVIYDSQNELYAMYKPLNVVGGEDYLSMKGTLISKTRQFVVSEPLTNVLQDVLTSEQCFDLVVVYDRMKGLKDLVCGNNVTKFFVINSSKEYESLKAQLKITDPTHIITNVHSNIETGQGKSKQTLDIPYIEGYDRATDIAKTSKYIKLTTSWSDENLINIISKKTKANTLFHN